MLQDYLGAFLLILASYAVALISSSIRNDRRQLAAFLFIVTSLHLLSLFNYFVFTLPGAERDASTFHRHVIEALNGQHVLEFSIGTGLYEQILFHSYSVLGANKLVGQSLSILAAAISLVLMLKIASHFLIHDRLKPVLIIIVGLTPSFLLYASLTLREVYQLLGLVSGIYFACLAFSEKSPAKLVISFCCFIFMGAFHHVLLALSFVLILMTCFFYFLASGVARLVLIKSVVMSTLIVLVAGYLVVVKAPTVGGDDYLEILERTGGVVNMIGLYRESIEKDLPRSSYGFTVGTETTMELGAGLVRSYVYYLFGPSIISIDKPIDIVPAINSLGRLLVFVLLAVALYRKLPMPVGLGYLVIVYLLVTALWSIGTTNYGQAFRHNSLTDWILALILTIGIQAILNSRNRARTQT